MKIDLEDKEELLSVSSERRRLIFRVKVEVRMDVKGCEEDEIGDWLTKTNYV